jgi:hypothetical protein
MNVHPPKTLPAWRTRLASCSRCLIRLTRAAASWIPLTPFALLALPLLVWLLLDFGVERHDRVLLAVTACGLALMALALLAVVLTVACLWPRRLRAEDEPLELGAGVPARTGYCVRFLNWLPLVKVEWAWEAPAKVEVRTTPRGSGLEEEVTANERGHHEEIVRRFTVSDVFGLTRFWFRRRQGRKVKVRPAPGAVDALRLLPQYDAGDLMAHPEGSPVGDLVEMREYGPGDPLKRVLWKVYARTGRLLVRLPEKSVMPCERTLAYLVAGEGDEPSAGVARHALESGALRADFVFGADGADNPTSETHEGLEQVVRSAGAREQGGDGLERFLAHGEAEGLRACVLFVPHTRGAWLDRVAEQVARRPGPFRVLVGVDGLRPAEKGSPLRRLLLRRRTEAGACPEQVRQVHDRLCQAGAEVTLVDRTTGEILVLPEAPAGAANRTDQAREALPAVVP